MFQPFGTHRQKKAVSLQQIINHNMCFYEKKAPFVDPVTASRRAAGQDVHAAHPVFTTNYLQHAYRVSRDSFTAFFNGRPVTALNVSRILAAVIDDTPAASASTPVALPASVLADPAVATLVAKAALCDLICAVINAHGDV